jgi:hypothetical protein
MRIAGKFQKNQATLEDFLLAILHSETDPWFVQILDFIGIDPRALDSELVEINTLIAGAGSGTGEGMFGQIDELIETIEDTFGGIGKTGEKTKE